MKQCWFKKTPLVLFFQVSSFSVFRAFFTASLVRHCSRRRQIKGRPEVDVKNQSVIKVFLPKLIHVQLNSGSPFGLHGRDNGPNFDGKLN